MEGVLLTLLWNEPRTYWSVKLRYKYFGNTTQVGSFKQLSEATAAMDYLDEALKDKSKQEKIASVDEVIEHVQSNFNTTRVQWQV